MLFPYLSLLWGTGMKISPNHISTTRPLIFGTMVSVFLSQGLLLLAIFSMIIGEATDLLDGCWARRTGQVSDIGKIYDPMCDSIFHMMIWMTLLAMGWIPVCLAILFFARDSIVSTIRTFMATKNFVMAARVSGKVKMWAQAIAQISLVLLHYRFGGNAAVMAAGMAMVWAAALITALSLADYGLAAKRAMPKGK